MGTFFKELGEKRPHGNFGPARGLLQKLWIDIKNPNKYCHLVMAKIVIFTVFCHFGYSQKWPNGHKY